jgi:hypothetical protein
MSNTVWKMKEPSTGLIREPRFYVLPGRSSCLWWVAEAENGGGKNEALVFNGLEAYKCTYFLGYSRESMTADRLVDLGKTSWLEEVSGRPKRKSDALELRHFAICFLDESPLFEFLARGFQFQSPFDVRIIELTLQQRIASSVHPLERSKTKKT